MNTSALALDFDRIEKGFVQLRSPWKVAAFTATMMPLGAMAGLRIDHVDRDGCVTSLPGGWRTQNPFKSMFWAAQGMAAEMATGVPALVGVREAPVPVRMILAGCEGQFVRMCKTRARFVFERADLVWEALETTLATGESVECPLPVVGYDAHGEEVSRWRFTWSFRARLPE